MPEKRPAPSVAQRGKAAEPIRVGAHRVGQIVVGVPGEVEGVRGVRLVLHSRIEQRQDLKVDPCGVHLLEAKRAPVVQPLIRNVVVGSQPGGGDIVRTRRIPRECSSSAINDMAPPRSVRHQIARASVHALPKPHGAYCRGVRALVCFVGLGEQPI